MTGLQVVVMGVSGCGKTTVGSALAARLGMGFVDGDDLHPAGNIVKMTAGRPLTDEDRWLWLARVGAALAGDGPDGIVIACSALKRGYRDAIRRSAPAAVFVHLAGSRELLMRRIAARTGHFMPAELLDSQFADLEPLAGDERGVVIDVAPSRTQVIEAAVAGLAASAVADETGCPVHHRR